MFSLENAARLSFAPPDSCKILITGDSSVLQEIPAREFRLSSSAVRWPGGLAFRFGLFWKPPARRRRALRENPTQHGESRSGNWEARSAKNRVRDPSRLAVRTWPRKKLAAKIFSGNAHARAGFCGRQNRESRPALSRKKFLRVPKSAAKAERTEPWPRPDVPFRPSSGQGSDNAGARPPRGQNSPAEMQARRERPERKSHTHLQEIPRRDFPAGALVVFLARASASLRFFPRFCAGGVFVRS